MKHVYRILFTIVTILYALPISVSGQTTSNPEMLDYEKLSTLPVSELFHTGEELHKKSHTDTAMGYYIILAGKYNQSMTEADKYLCAMACVLAGEIYFQKGIYQQAFEMYFKGIQICEENKFEKLLARFYKNVGNVYNVYKDTQLAFGYYLKGLKLARQYGDISVEARLLSNLTTAYTFAGDFKNARNFYRQMMEYPHKDSLFEYHRFFNKGLIDYFEGRPKEAVEPFRKAYQYAESHNLEPQYTTSAIGDLANLYQQIGKGDSALHYYHLNEQYTSEHNLPYYHMITLKALQHLYDSIGNKNKADYYQRKYAILSDSVINLEKFNQLKNAQIIYELDKNFKKINSLTQEKNEKEKQVQEQRKLLLLISVGLLVFAGLSLIIYIQKKKLYGAYTNLFRKNTEIAQSEQLIRELRNECIQKPTDSTTTEQPAEEDKSTLKIGGQQKENLLAQINRIMEETTEFCDSEFSLEKLATLVGSNSKYVSQIINETYNKNFRTFVNEYRIREACRRLTSPEEFGNYTVQAIGESVGYKSRANFTELFKKTTGLTPAMYQKIAKEGTEIGNKY